MRTEKIPLDFSGGVEESYNAFSMNEPSSAIILSKNTSPEPDQIQNVMPQQPPERGKKIILDLFKRIWREHTIPDIWREATIIPIPKEGKDRLLLNYLPISLTSYVGKIFERMVNHRLVWSLVSRSLLTTVQCGFSKFCSSLDHLVKLAT